jgi:outer membrane receptor protein involved in Fe transport
LHGFSTDNIAKFNRSVLQRRRKLRISNIILATLVGSCCAIAEPTPVEYADTVLTLPQVSVTAIKGGHNANRDEAVTTLGENAINRLNIVNLKQLSEIAPNFYMPQYGSKMTASVYVRGLGTRIDQPVIGLNIDNLPIINKDNFDFDIADIQRIEVVRGPQNILYGRNTMGGLINIYTLSPLSFEGLKVTAGYGTQNSYRGSLGYYHRLSSALGMSLNLATSGTDGFYRNSYNNSRVGVERSWSGRWKTSWRPSSKFMLENSAAITHNAQHGYPYESAESGRIAYNDTCFYRRTSITDGLTANAHIGNVTLSGIAGFQYIDDNLTLDQDFLPLNYFTLSQMRHEFAFTTDFVARSNIGQRYNWLLGAFGFARRSFMSAPVTFFNYGLEQLIESNANSLNSDYPIKWDQRQLALGSDFTLPSGGASLYHESAFTLGKFTATLGLRLDWERTSIKYHSYSSSTYSIYDATGSEEVIYAPSQPININDVDKLTKSFTQLLPKLSLSYALPERTGNIFASITKGYKSGGYNTQMFSDVLKQRIMSRLGIAQLYDVDDIVSYAPEKTWNYEIGAHISMLNNTLNWNATAFWINCRDQQLTVFPEGSITGRIMTNAGQSRSRGVELSATASLPRGFFLRASYGFTDAKFTSFFNGKTDYSGHTVPYAPKHTMYAGIVYDHDFARHSFINSISINLNTRGVGEIYWNEANSLSQPFYMLLNASVRLTHGNLSTDLWADNITSTRYYTFYCLSINNAFMQRGNKFAAGVTIHYTLPY